MSKKNKTLILYIAALFIVVAVSYFRFSDYEVSAGSEHNVSGWAWPENIGWISFNSANQGGGANYGVNVAQNGDLSGYAWSENIGWISFNETTGCPSSPCKPKLNRQNGQVSGWAKAIAADGNGWDGWIHLKGTNYGVTVSGCSWQGYAWGSDVVGWVHFRGTNYGVNGTGDACQAPPVEQCKDGIDNDGDGLIDLADPGCSGPLDNNEKNACGDGVDNDADGKIDYPADPGCVSLQDNDETDAPQCSDTADNDNDGKIDYPADLGCSDAVDNKEGHGCSDGLDNDSDGKIDYPADPGCATPSDENEENPLQPKFQEIAP